jgi:hypothetical protein
VVKLLAIIEPSQHFEPGVSTPGLYQKGTTMRYSSLQHPFAALVLVGVSITLTGCGREPHASASGTVTLNGAGLKHRVVLTFVGPDHIPWSTQSDDQGEFHIANLPLGETVVTASSIPDGGPATRPLGAPNEKSSAGTRLTRQAHSLPQEVPASYGDAAHPLLRYTLQEGENALQINLVTRAK